MIFYADDELIPGKYKVLLGAETEQVSVSKFVTVIVESSSIILSESVAFDDNLAEP